MKGNWVIFLIPVIAVSCSTAKRYYGNYFNNKRYWGAMYVLKEDSTFEFTRRTNAGTVSITKELPNSIITETTDS